MGTIINGANIPLNQMPQGSVPDVSGALQDKFQLMIFETVAKSTIGFQDVEAGTQISFWGNIQPFKPTDLQIQAQGERKWDWYWIHAEPAIVLNPDDVILVQGTQYRIMQRNNNTLAGFIEYVAIQDWTGSGP